MRDIETERLTLRPLRESDAEDLRRIFLDPEFADYLQNAEVEPDHTRGEIVRHLDDHWKERGYGLFAAILKKEGEFIGRCGFLHQELEGEDLCEVAYLIAREHWGQGYATEAARSLVCYGFEILEKDLLVSLIHRKNARSIRVAEKIGMSLLKEHPLMFKYGISRETASCEQGSD